MSFPSLKIFRFFIVWFCIITCPALSYGATEMPPFSLESVQDGLLVDSGEFENKAVFINFFATWCPPCKAEIPAFVKVQQEFSDKDFTILGLSMDVGKTDLVKSFIDEYKINYPVLLADDDVIMRYGGIYTIPTSFLVDRKGNVVKMYQGIVSHSTLVKDIKAVLK